MASNQTIRTKSMAIKKVFSTLSLNRKYHTTHRKALAMTKIARCILNDTLRAAIFANFASSSAEISVLFFLFSSIPVKTKGFLSVRR